MKYYITLIHFRAIGYTRSH